MDLRFLQIKNEKSRLDESPTYIGHYSINIVQRVLEKVYT